MTTFNQVIDAFVAGSKAMVEDDNISMNIAIYHDTLIGISKYKVEVIAIRLSNDLIIRNTSWPVLTYVHNLKYLYKKCRELKIHTIHVDEVIGTIDKSIFLEQAIQCENTIKKSVGDSLISEKVSGYKDVPALVKYRKYCMDVSKATIDKYGILSMINLHNHLATSDSFAKIALGEIKRSQQILNKLDQYLQVCIKLPEISSPDIPQLKSDEQPGGNDSDIFFIQPG